MNRCSGVRASWYLLGAISLWLTSAPSSYGQWSAAKLSSARFQPAAASAGTKIVFAGGNFFRQVDPTSSEVDIFDEKTGKWSKALLSAPRSDIAVASSSGKIFFAGGDGGTRYSDVVDIYDAEKDKWSTAKLSVARTNLCATAVGSKLLFAGGVEDGKFLMSDVVDIYDLKTEKWSTAKLSQARSKLAAASVGSRAFFAGGYTSRDEMSDRVDIYNDATGEWTTAQLSVPRRDLAATAIGDKVMFAGGEAGDGESSRVDIYDQTSNSWSTYQLSVARFDLASASAHNKALFAGGHQRSSSATSDVVDIYDDNTGVWSSSKLSSKRNSIGAAVLGRKFYFAGGWIDVKQAVTDVIDIYNVDYVRDTNAPTVTLEFENDGVADPLGRVLVHLKITDESPLRSVLINGQQQIAGETRYVFVKDITVKSGELLSISATDNGGIEKILDREIYGRQPTLPDNNPKQSYYAMLIGVNNYEDKEIEPLSNPIADATKLQRILIDRYGFEEDRILFLKNPELSDLFKGFRTIRDKVTSNDLLLIFYAGHGYLEPGSEIGFWLPADADKSDGSRWFRNSSLVEDIRAIQAKHILLITDACFAGSIFKTRSPFNNASPMYFNMMKHKSRKAMTSGAHTPVPDNSLFMHYLLKILDENPNMYLDSEELYHQIRERMKNNTNLTPLYGEIKDAGDEGGVFVFKQQKKP